MAGCVGAGQVSPHPEWRIIVDHLRDASYGVAISHTEMGAWIGLHVGEKRYHQQVGRARHALLVEHQRELATVTGRGYRLVLPTEFHGRARREVRLAGRRIRRGKSVLHAAPQHLLSASENQRNADALAKFGLMESMRASVMRDTRPSLPAPRADVPKMLSASSQEARTG